MRGERAEREQRELPTVSAAPQRAPPCLQHGGTRAAHAASSSKAHQKEGLRCLHTVE